MMVVAYLYQCLNIFPRGAREPAVRGAACLSAQYGADHVCLAAAE